MAVDYEHRLVVARDHELAALAAQHQTAHEREHEFNEKQLAATNERFSAELNAVKAAIDRLEAAGATFMTLDRFDREHEPVLETQRKAENALTALLAQLGTLRGIIVFLGLPGVVALAWAIVGAASGHPVSGPGGIVP